MRISELTSDPYRRRDRFDAVPSACSTVPAARFRAPTALLRVLGALFVFSLAFSLASYQRVSCNVKESGQRGGNTYTILLSTNVFRTRKSIRERINATTARATP